MPPPKTTGRPRIYCSDECRHAAKRQADTTGWSNTGPIAIEVDPATRRRRLYEQVDRLLDGARSSAPADQLAVLAIEASQLAFTARRLSKQLPAGARGCSARLEQALTAIEDEFAKLMEPTS